MIRRAPLRFELTGRDGKTRREPAFAAEIARRVAGVKLSFTPAGALESAGAVVPLCGGEKVAAVF